MRRLDVRSARPRRCATLGAALLSASISLLPSSPALAQRPAPPHRRGEGAAASAGARERAPSFAVRGTVSGDDIVRAARRFIGVPYRLGGTTPAAFDCSGFVRRVFAEYGVELPRTAHEQAAVGSAPEPGDLRPGDLLFFYGGHGAQHIAIYVGGDTIVHASSRGRRVQLDRLGGAGHRRRSWFNERLIAVRRVAPVEGVFRLEGVSASTDPPPPSAAASLGTAHGQSLPAAVTASIPRL
jgi:cell wall-associated NlpC family hydrolase